ncbi:MSCRAMM family protein [Propionibacterium freudenreichii]|uniref:MSCRAMM family protein n=1 Tax=Propionibacterium freudenreichii TaxID=1744 RepID=UPI0004A18D54|nr:SpaA isopeptide-forming pilin-related protein [Propionibacterium freudenreichii]MCT3011411.1 hypothetical protein [Propionibacterium freudenreichii]MDK9301859.1 hypothetical protein [Propionibacterium freudenreichii]MDK9319387.1 hypothetical protein [Propionibacterium freudenreichii]MDK9641824.1 hypothetical protein [Propionibacterium freudenreichii]CDP48174.1 Protein of unknown function [Propionibacterium freudenreichii subsp. freudenreichii]
MRKTTRAIAAAGLAVAMVAGGGAGIASAQITWESAPSAHQFTTTENNIAFFTSVAGGGAVLMVDRVVDETGRPLVCVDFSKPSPSGQTLQPLGKASPQLAFIANKLADPSSDGNLAGLNDRQQYYVLQYVAHMYDSSQFANFTDESGGAINDPDGLIPRIQAIKAEADAATDQNFMDNHAISVSTASPASKLGTDGTWLSDPVTVHVDSSGAKVEVSATLDEAGTKVGAQIVDAAGNPVTTVADGAQVRIKAADDQVKGADTSVTATLTANWTGGKERIGYLYGGDDAVQQIVGFDELTFNNTLAASFSTHFAKVVGSVSGTKIGADSAKLAGVTFALEDKAGVVQQSATTGADGSFNFANVPWGTWYVHETKTLDGYVLADGRRAVTIDGTHQVITLGDISNSLASGQIVVHKVDQDHKALPGAEFTLTDQTGSAIKAVTGTDGSATFTILANHTYKLAETKTPDGYTGTFSKDGITLDHDGQVLEFTATNTKQSTGNGGAGQGLASVNTGEPPSNAAMPFILIGLILVAGGGTGIAVARRKMAAAK